MYTSYNDISSRLCHRLQPARLSTAVGPRVKKAAY